MRMWRRKVGSQRSSAPVGVTLEPNWAGQDGKRFLVLRTDDGAYVVIEPETADDVKALMSHAHILHHNFQ